MLRNRFAILLAERGLKITRVSEETGIARSTLNNIRKNETNTIRLSTLQTLCDYLRITPNDFFNYNGMHEPLDLQEKWEENKNE